MKIGSLVYATDQGLGVLAKAFYDHKVVTDVLVVEHSKHENHFEWYPDSPTVSGSDIKRNTIARDFCAAMDAMLFFETPFDWHLMEFCRYNGVTTFLMPMYECTPSVLPGEPDYWLFPSLLDAREFMPNCYPKSPFSFSRDANGRRGFFTPVPVDSRVTWRHRTEAKVFVHNAGHGGLLGRNGTRELLEALRYVKSPAKFLIRSQAATGTYDSDLFPLTQRKFLGGCAVQVLYGTFPYNELYNAGDVFIFPEKFNGLSLPLQEARAAGMLVIGTDRFPMNQWLPEPLIQPSGYRRSKVGAPYREFDEAVVDPMDIAVKVDEWYGRDITEYSASGKEWATLNSWEVLGAQYIHLIYDLLGD